MSLLHSRGTGANRVQQFALAQNSTVGRRALSVLHRTTRTRAHGSAEPAPAALVDELLRKIDGSDGGLALPEEQRAEVDSLIDQLSELGAQQVPRPLQDPLLFGNYVVAYTSTRRAPSERGQPAGGRFRGRLGRTLFRTAGLFQSVLPPATATNKVAFKLFGLLPGSVGLRGRIEPVDAPSSSSSSSSSSSAGGGGCDTVKVWFEPPVLSLGDALHVRIGPTSSVQLTTTYLDERVRLGRGSRGSLFVFTRGGAADAARMEAVGAERSSWGALAALCAALGAVIAGGVALWTTGGAALRVAALAMWLLAAAVALVVYRGGILEADDEAGSGGRSVGAAAEQQVPTAADRKSIAEPTQQAQAQLEPAAAAASGV